MNILKLFNFFNKLKVNLKHNGNVSFGNEVKSTFIHKNHVASSGLQPSFTSTKGESGSDSNWSSKRSCNFWMPLKFIVKKLDFRAKMSLIYYLEQKYIGKIIIRLLIHQMTRKNISWSLRLFVCILWTTITALIIFICSWKDILRKDDVVFLYTFRAEFFLSISNDAWNLLHSCLLTNHLIYKWVWSDHGNDKAILWHHCSSLKVGQQP